MDRKGRSDRRKTENASYVGKDRESIIYGKSKYTDVYQQVLTFKYS